VTSETEHILVTPPDRYWSDAFSILLVDFDFQLAENIINPLRSSTIDLAIHLYSSTEDNHEWLLNVANASNIVVLNLTQITNNDIFKGQLISKHNVWYTGRRYLDDTWDGYTDDVLSTLLIEIDKQQKSKEKNEKRL
jgi:RNAse (barnase) inhibitor barstar